MLANAALWPTATKQWLDENSQRIRTADSQATYDKVLCGLQKRHPNKRVAQFTADDVLSFCGEPGLAPATLSQRRTVLLGFFRWAKRAVRDSARAASVHRAMQRSRFAQRCDLSPMSRDIAKYAPRRDSLRRCRGWWWFRRLRGGAASR